MLGDNNNNPSNNNSSWLDSWTGQRVTISGVGGRVYLRADGSVKTGWGRARVNDVFVVERADPLIHGPNKVAFCWEEPAARRKLNPSSIQPMKRYLTQHLYGDAARREVSDALFQVDGLLPEMVPSIVEYAVGDPTPDSNFEGEGFNYRPMSAEVPSNSNNNSANQQQQQHPNVLQVFELVPQPRSRHSFGIRSRFGKYWRSQHWDHVVSQSPHCLGDETWTLTIQQSQHQQQS